MSLDFSHRESFDAWVVQNKKKVLHEDGGPKVRLKERHRNRCVLTSSLLLVLCHQMAPTTFGAVYLTGLVSLLLVPSKSKSMYRDYVE